MATTPIERPSFHEGQVLAGADLDAVVAHARGQAARHARFLHLWGIASGLALQAAPKKTASGVTYQEVTLTAGMAVDASGRELVLGAPDRLRDEDFDASGVTTGQTAEAWYPVFLYGRDERPPGAPVGLGGCGATEPSRWQERVEIQFGRPGDEVRSKEAALDVDAPPYDGTQDESEGRVLLGFVQWRSDVQRFAAVTDKVDGVGRRYAGVQADAVEARGGALVMRTGGAPAKGRPGLALDDTDGARLAFGTTDALGQVLPVFQVNAKGDLKITGRFESAVIPGSVQVQSGVATDGVLLPLPPGITQEMLDQGQATAHVQLTPSVPPSAPPSGAGDWVALPSECRVDADRRVHCVARWIDLSGGTPLASAVALPGSCDYLVMVSVASAS